MASEIKFRVKDGTEVADYFTITDFLAGTIWNRDTDGPALEALVVANWYNAAADAANYNLPLTETPASSNRYVGDWPATLTAVGYYMVDIYEKAGATPDIDDAVIGSLLGYWDGTYFRPVSADVEQWKGAVAPAMTGDAYAVANGRLPAALTSNGNIKASLMEILTTALTETAGLLAAGFKKFFNVATPTGTVNSIPDAVAGAASGLAIVGSAMGLSDDAITSAKFDESTAFPLKSADTGSTAVARTGADGDTLETLSDQIDLQATSSALTVVKELLDTTAVAELAADPGATPAGIIKLLMLLYMKARNAETTTNSAKTVKNDAGVTILTHTLADDGTTFTKSKVT